MRICSSVILAWRICSRCVRHNDEAMWKGIRFSSNCSTVAWWSRNRSSCRGRTLAWISFCLKRIDVYLDEAVDKHQHNEVDFDFVRKHSVQSVYLVHPHTNNNDHHIEWVHNCHWVDIEDDDQSYEDLILDTIQQHKLWMRECCLSFANV